MFAQLFKSCFSTASDPEMDLDCHEKCVIAAKRVICEESREESPVPRKKKRCELFDVVPSVISPAVPEVSGREKRASSEDSIIYVGCETLTPKTIERERLILKVKKNKVVVTPQTITVAAEVHAPPSTSSDYVPVIEDISEPEDGTPVLTYSKPSVEDEILNIADYKWEEIEKPMTEVKVLEKKIISESQPSLNTVVADVLQITNSDEAHHIAFCDDFKGGLVAALERHRDRLKNRLDENTKDSDLLEEAVQNIFSYAKKMMEAFHLEKTRLIVDLNNTKTLLANAVKSDSRDLFSKNAAGDIRRCGMTDEGA
ncbi:uncharacterized protein LOC126887144 [Diabrotica virgifera virgifera]|uniref:Uncharacterized protein n=2 Tax=Diabrotica virgifera virgifera TaxID=50390 RepID=A0ABM5KJT3_DIAVI|nr:uncharacterized protein LOC126887144 [Diabrotica virgifera virgifera]